MAESDIPIEELQLSVRTFNCLKRSGIRTLKQLLSFRSETSGKEDYGRSRSGSRTLGTMSACSLNQSLNRLLSRPH